MRRILNSVLSHAEHRLSVDEGKLIEESPSRRFSVVLEVAQGA